MDGKKDDEQPSFDGAKFEEFKQLFRDHGEKLDALSENVAALVEVSEAQTEMMDDLGQVMSDLRDTIDLLRKVALQQQANPFTIGKDIIQSALTDRREEEEED